MALEMKKPLVLGTGSATTSTSRVTEDVMRSDIDEVGIGFLDLVDIGLDVLHVVEVFDGSLFAGGDDEALLAHAQRDLGLARLEFDGLWQLDDFA